MQLSINVKLEKNTNFLPKKGGLPLFGRLPQFNTFCNFPDEVIRITDYLTEDSLWRWAIHTRIPFVRALYFPGQNVPKTGAPLPSGVSFLKFYPSEVQQTLSNQMKVRHFHLQMLQSCHNTFTAFKVIFSNFTLIGLSRKGSPLRCFSRNWVGNLGSKCAAGPHSSWTPPPPGIN